MYTRLRVRHDEKRNNKWLIIFYSFLNIYLFVCLFNLMQWLDFIKLSNVPVH